MKIAMVDEWVAPPGQPFIGGPDSRLLSLCHHLKEKNDIHIVTSHLPGGDRIEDHGGITVHRVGKKRQPTQRGDFSARLMFCKHVVSKVKVLRPDLVNAAGFVSYEAGYKAARAIEVPSVVTVHEVWLGEWIRNMGLFNGTIGHILEKHRLKQNFDGYIAVSNFTKNKLISAVGVDPALIDVVYNGINPEIYSPGSDPEKFNEPTVLCICRLVEYKRVGDLIRAVGTLKSEQPEIRLKIVGTGPQKEYLERLTRRMKLEARVDFLGKIPDTQEMARILKKSHVFALPSIAEGFGMVIVEAMASGVPFVASRIPAIQEVTENGRGGLLFNPTDHTDLAEKIMILMEDNALTQEKISEGTILSKRYHWDVLSAHLEQCYRCILSQPGML